MKKVLFITFGLLVITCGMCAQTVQEFRQMTAKQKAQIITDTLKVTLQLSEKQYNDLYSIILDGAQQATTITATNGSRLEKGKNLRAVLLTEETKMKLILSTQQYQLFEEKKQKAIAYYKKRFQSEKLMLNVPD